MIISENISVKKFNTFQIDAQADFMVQIEDPDDLNEFRASDLFRITPRFVLGGGSNVLFTQDFKGVLLKSEIKTLETIGSSDDYVDIRAGSGMEWDSFTEYCVDNNWGGIENLSYIPGSIGAAPVQNIGAYGVEVKDTVTQVEAFNIDTGVYKIYSNKDCHFGYRNSIFKELKQGSLFITHVVFRLNKKPVLDSSYGSLNSELEKLGNRTVQSVRQAVIAIRKSRLPEVNELPSAGSFFKNPLITKELFHEIASKHPDIPHYLNSDTGIKIPAAWLIESCGLKGFKTGNAGTYKNQPLVLVNYGDSTGKEIVELAKYVQQKVFEKFGINLQPEVCFV